MKKLAIVVASILLGFGLAGCGGSNGVSVAPQDKASNTTQTVTVQQDTQVQAHQLRGTTNDGDYEYSIVDIKMPSGRTLTCLQDDSVQDYPVSISCNWEDYNRRGN